MQKSYLFELISLVSEVIGDELPIIVGSQSFFAQTDDPPLSVKESEECDFLLFGGKAAERDTINREYGVFSEFSVKKSFFADALGLASVTLPTGWEDRLKPLYDPDGKIVAKCLDPYDLAACKIAAGRPKDLEFLQAALTSELLTVEEFLERSLLVRSKLENDALKDRFERLIDHLQSKHIHSRIADKIRQFIKETF